MAEGLGRRSEMGEGCPEWNGMEWRVGPRQNGAVPP